MRKCKFTVYKFNKAIKAKILNLTFMERFIKQFSNDLVHKLFCERNSTIESIDKSDIKSDRLKPHSFLAERILSQFGLILILIHHQFTYSVFTLLIAYKVYKADESEPHRKHNLKNC